MQNEVAAGFVWEFPWIDQLCLMNDGTLNHVGIPGWIWSIFLRSVYGFGLRAMSFPEWERFSSPLP